MITEIIKASKAPTLLHHKIYVEAIENPGKIALIDFQSGQQWLYRQLVREIEKMTLILAERGISQGDRVVVNAPLSPQFVSILYACIQLGAIFCPLSPKEDTETIIDRIYQIQPKVVFVNDPSSELTITDSSCASIEKVYRIKKTSSNGLGRKVINKLSEYEWRLKQNRYKKRILKIEKQLHKWSPVALIFGPDRNYIKRPATYCHENILLQTKLFKQNSFVEEDTRMLVNTPVHKLAGLVQSLINCLSLGHTAVLMESFHVASTLSAIEQHKITHIVQTPKQYEQLWKSPAYKSYDLSSLRFGVYLPLKQRKGFLTRLKQMLPEYGTGLWLTESAGFATFSKPKSLNLSFPHRSIKHAVEGFAQLSIRETMAPDGKAGDEIPDGRVGEVCIDAPSVFLGYYAQGIETSKILSKEGFLYTGRLGYILHEGDKRLLHLVEGSLN